MSATPPGAEPRRLPEKGLIRVEDWPDVTWLDATRLAVVGIGALYAIGLLIVNIELGRYGVISLDLARPEYVMVGTLWLFLTIPTTAALHVAVESFRRRVS